MVFWNHRLALLHGDVRFADLVERLLYNGGLSGISLDGASFFYVNPLASSGDHHRQPWYGCACCPTNVVRFIASLGQYAYAARADGDGVCVLQYIGGTTTILLPKGNVRLTQTTRYPWEGKVRIAVETAIDSEFSLQLRIPAWSSDAAVSLNGTRVTVAEDKGFVSLRRRWKSGDTIELDLPLPVRQVAADPRVESNVGRRAILRGPVVYCLEDVDNPCPVDQVAIAEGTPFEAEYRGDVLGGVTLLKVQGRRQSIVETADGFHSQEGPVALTAIPYFAWDNRDAGNMAVWIPCESRQTNVADDVTVAIVARPAASHCWPQDRPSALNDGRIPEKSDDHSIPRFTWWNHRGTQEWVSYEFKQPKTLSKAEVYWFDDTGRGSCRVPASWRLSWKDGDQWRPVQNSSTWDVATDRFNLVTFEPVTTTALRMDVQLQEGFSGGILEWRLPR
jgi:hypothetical protein